MPRTIGWDPPRTPFTLSHVAAIGRDAQRGALSSGLRTGRAAGKGRVHRGRGGGRVTRRACTCRGRWRSSCGARRRSPVTGPRRWRGGWPSTSRRQRRQIPCRSSSRRRPNVRSLAGEGFVVAAGTFRPSIASLTPAACGSRPWRRTAVDVAAVEPSLPAALVVRGRGGAAAAHRRRRRTARARRTTSAPGALRAAVSPLREAAERAATQFTRVIVCWRPSRWRTHVGSLRLESFSFGQMVLHGIPLPQLQVRIRTAAG